MRKVLLSSAAVCGLALAASPALAEDGGVKLDIGGYFQAYGVLIDQDTGSLYTGTAEERDFDILRNTEVHLSGETTLDNGLTVGIHFEVEADGNYGDSFDVEESYMYMSGQWGRVNVGEEDGAAFLLQVAAPAADANLDGIRQLVQPVDYTLALADATGLYGATGGEGRFLDGFDYDQDIAGYATKITYLTPVLNGFQAGASYTPDVDEATRDNVGVGGISLDDLDEAYGEAFELAGRYEGQWNALGFALGAGYSHVVLERDADGATADEEIFNAGVANVDLDDRTAWNVGADFDYGAFGLGVVYMQDDLGYNNDAEEDVLVIGVDYTTGPFKLGASWLNQDNEIGPNAGEIETDRYTGGVVYTYGPGMTFRGSISYIEHDTPATFAINNGDDIEATTVMLGTQVLF